MFEEVIRHRYRIRELQPVRLAALVAAGSLLVASCATGTNDTEEADVADTEEADVADTEEADVADTEESAFDERSVSLAAFLTPEHTTWPATEELMAEIEEVSGGAWAVEDFPAGQIVSAGDSLDAILSGSADIVLIGVQIHPDRFPASQSWYLPQPLTEPQLTSGQWQSLHDPDSTLVQELKEVGVVLITTTFAPGNNLATVDVPLESIDSLDGLRLRSPSSPVDEVLNRLGAVAVDLPPADTFEALDRGSIDGVAQNLASWPDAGTDTLVNHLVEGVSFAPGSIMYGVSQDFWDSLSEDEQRMLYSAGRTASARMNELYLEQWDVVRDRLVDEEGLQTYEWPEEDHARLAEVLESVAADWSDGVDGGTDAVEEVLRFSEGTPAERAELVDDFDSFAF